MASLPGLNVRRTAQVKLRAQAIRRLRGRMCPDVPGEAVMGRGTEEATLIPRNHSAGPRLCQPRKRGPTFSGDFKEWTVERFLRSLRPSLKACASPCFL